MELSRPGEIGANWLTSHEGLVRGWYTYLSQNFQWLFREAFQLPQHLIQLKDYKTDWLETVDENPLSFSLTQNYITNPKNMKDVKEHESW